MLSMGSAQGRRRMGRQNVVFAITGFSGAVEAGENVAYDEDGYGGEDGKEGNEGENDRGGDAIWINDLAGVISAPGEGPHCEGIAECLPVRPALRRGEDDGWSVVARSIGRVASMVVLSLSSNYSMYRRLSLMMAAVIHGFG
jgi:hypothetical protein